MSVEKAELLLAELHYLMTMKKENHGLTRDDEMWLEVGRKHYVKHSERLDKDQIKMNLTLARLTGNFYVSVIFNTELTAQLAQAQNTNIRKYERAEKLKKLDISKQEGNK